MLSEHQISSNWTGELLGEMRLRDYLDIARRRKSWIILTTLAVSISTLVVALKLPSLYKAETVILVDPQKVPDNYVASAVTTSLGDRFASIKQQVLSPSRLKRLIDSLNLYPRLRGRRSEQELISMVQKAINVDVVSASSGHLNAFSIRYSGKDPVQVAQVANKLASLFMEEDLRVREQQSSGTTEFLEAELQDTKRQLEQKEEELRTIKSRYIMDLPESKQYHLEALTSLRNQLKSIQDRISRAQQEKVYLQSLMVTSAPTIDLDAGMAGTSSSPFQSQIQKLESRLSELQARYGSSYPDVRRVQKELEQLKAKAAAEEEKQPIQVQAEPVGPAPRASRNPVLEAQIQKLNQEIAEQTRLQPQLEEQINFHVSKLERVPVFEQQISGLMRDYDNLHTHYSRLLDKKLSAGMASALESRQQGERFVILDLAVPPEKPFAPNRLLVSLGGLFGGLLGGIALAVMVEMADESVRNEREAAKILGKPVLVGIPRMLTKQQRRWERVRALAVVAGTAVCSLALGLLISRMTGWFL